MGLVKQGAKTGAKARAAEALAAGKARQHKNPESKAATQAEKPASGKAEPNK